jgi:muramoyltetrapeptide carboxypeptidase
MTHSCLPCPPLPAAGHVELVACSSPFDAAALDRGRSLLAEHGLRVSPPPDLTLADRYLAAPDATRATALLDALTRPGVDVVMAARGGYGMTRLLPLLEPHVDRLRAAGPRLVVGFSDVTALHAWLFSRLGWQSVHGPVCTSFGLEPPVTRAHLINVLRGRAAGSVLQGETLRGSGVVRGPLVGGNLAVLTALVGTPFFPDLTGCVLLLEDVTERPHRVDRMLTQLLQATGGLRGVVGVVLGYFTDCDDTQKGHRTQDTLREVLGGLSMPVVGGLPVGHQAPNHALPHGGLVGLDAGGGTLTVLEEMVTAA